MVSPGGQQGQLLRPEAPGGRYKSGRRLSPALWLIRHVIGPAVRGSLRPVNAAGTVSPHDQATIKHTDSLPRRPGHVPARQAEALSISSHPQVGPAFLEPRHPSGPGNHEPQQSEAVEQDQEIPDDGNSDDPVVPSRSVRPGPVGAMRRSIRDDRSLRYVRPVSSGAAVTPT